MEFLDGGSIKNHLTEKQTPFPESDIAYVMERVLKGLAFIHEKGYIHRDIKSANIMLTSSGKVKISMLKDMNMLILMDLLFIEYQ